MDYLTTRDKIIYILAKTDDIENVITDKDMNNETKTLRLMKSNIKIRVLAEEILKEMNNGSGIRQ